MEYIKEKLSMIYCLETAEKILNSKILVVGSGGIGCELVKSLSISGF
jgi:tRNA A37 threonylcarbamoyladenosine dehydratase